MFSRLRNRFLILNMVIITFIMLVAFSAIYTITYQNNRKDVDDELHRISEVYRKPGGGKFGGGMDHGPNGDMPHFFEGDKGGFPPDRSVSFALTTDSRWNVTEVNTRFDMDSDFYANAVEKVAEQGKNIGQFTLDNNRWAYMAQSYPDGNYVVFLDVTAHRKFMMNLLYTFLAVGAIMLVVIYFTSRYFAGRSIAPVREAFLKQQRFIADASHELKTPLAVINTNAEVLLANSDETIRDQAKWLHHIKSETERMKTLTNDLLYLTEMEDARAEVLFAPFDLSHAVESVILTLEAVIFEKNIALSYDIQPGLSAHGNAEQMKQVVMILLDNAIKYTPSGGSIELKLGRQHHDTLLSVTNTGEGIQPEHLGKIFDRFYRVDPSRSRKHGGYGLGLAIAKAIVEQHKGKIYARSVLNEATTFYVQFHG